MCKYKSVYACVEYMHIRIGIGRGGRTSSKSHMKSLHSILGYAESLRKFTEIKQVNAESNAWNTFVLKIEHLRKSEKSLDVGVSPHSMPRCYRL